MARSRSYSLEFKRQVKQQYLSGEIARAALARQHETSPTLLRVWVAKYKAGEFDNEGVQRDPLARYEARIAELGCKGDQLIIENEWLKKRNARRSWTSAAISCVVRGPVVSRSGEAAKL